MLIIDVVPQLRTTNLADSIHFYTAVLGGTLEFLHRDFYAGIRLGNQTLHLKFVDQPDASVAVVREGGHFHLYIETGDVILAAETLQRKGIRLVCGVHQTTWGTREFVLEDNQGHTLYFGQRD